MYSPEVCIEIPEALVPPSPSIVNFVLNTLYSMCLIYYVIVLCKNAGRAKPVHPSLQTLLTKLNRVVKPEVHVAKLELDLGTELQEIYDEIVALYNDLLTDPWIEWFCSIEDYYCPLYILPLVVYSVVIEHVAAILENDALAYLLYDIGVAIADARINAEEILAESQILADLETLINDSLARAETFLYPFLTALSNALEDGKITALEQLKLTTLATLALPKLTTLAGDVISQLTGLGERLQEYIPQLTELASRLVETIKGLVEAALAPPTSSRKLLF